MLAALQITLQIHAALQMKTAQHAVQLQRDLAAK